MKKFENLGRKLSKDEQKKIQGALTTPGCMQEYEYDCHRLREPYPCCAGLVCVDNATNTGTICMLANPN